jgi:hypothetical protein
VVGAITVADLPVDHAMAMLHERGIRNRALSGELIARFGANPLVLRLLGDYAEQQKSEDAVRGLLEEEGGQHYRAAAAQRILYSRILGRIRGDEALRTLASPGLIVRIVTPGVIRRVLAEPCGLGRIPQDRAEELFAKLARQVWLVRRQSEVAVTHRRDMRTVMLPLANQPGPDRTREELEQSIAEIHRLAVEFHRDPKLEDPELAPEVRRTEALYHELFSDPEAAFRSKDLSAALPNLGVDIQDFPPGTRARLKEMLGRTLSKEEYLALDRERQIAHQSRAAEQQLKSTGSTGPVAAAAAVAPAQPEPAGAIGTRESVEGLAALEGSDEKPAPAAKMRAVKATDTTGIIGAFAYGEFEEIAGQARKLLLEFVSRALSKRGARLEREMTNHVTWLAALSTLVTPVDEANDWRLELANDLAVAAAQTVKSPDWPRLEDKSQLTLGHYISALIVLVSQGAERSVAADEFIYSQRKMKGSTDPTLNSTTALRIFQMFAVADREGAFMWRPTSVSVDRLQMFAPLLEPDVVKKYDASMIAAHSAWTRTNPNLGEHEAVLRKLVPSATGPASSMLAGIERSELQTRFDLYHWHHPRAPQDRMTRKMLTLPWAAFRGISPDLHPPIVSALRRRFADLNERSRILRRLRKCSAMWPSDLQFAGIGAEPEVSDTFVATVAHFADRFAAIPVLFMGAAPESLSGKVARVYEAYSDLVASVTRDAPRRTRKPSEPVRTRRKAPPRR